MGTILNYIYKLFFLSRYEKLMGRLKDAVAAQEQIRKTLIKRNINTKIGKEFQFATITSYENFKRQIPVRSYEIIEPEILRCMEGIQNEFWCDDIKKFGKSSGTTSRSKYIPLTMEGLKENHYRGGIDMITMYLKHFPSSELFNGKNLVISGSFENRKNISVGDISAHIIKNLPFWIRYYRIPSLKISLERDWNYKLNKITVEAIKQKMVALSGIPSWMMVLLQKMKDDQAFSRRYWKDIEVFFHGGIHFEPLKLKFEELLEREINYFQLYNATEGFFAMQEKFGTLDMLLLTHHGIFYEFAAIENYKPNYDKVDAIADVEVGKNYEMIITTNSGLWRYALGDIVEITQKNPTKILVIGRTKQYINIYGEELMVHNAELGMAAACLIHQCTFIDFTAAPLLLEHEKGCHEWWIEFDKKPKDIDAFARELDNQLRLLNSDYDAKRTDDLLLQNLKVKSLPEKTFYNWLASNKKLGGQHKVSKLKNNRQFLEELYAFID